MFTGIIETIGIVESVSNITYGSKLAISVKNFLDDVKIGSSIAVNGVCLTVTEMKKNSFLVNVINETLSKSTLSAIKKGDMVNLEKALRVSDRFDGHFVQGHIDGTAEITRYEKSGGNIIVSVQLPKEFSESVVKKGSIAIDGISLTVADVNKTVVSVALIPLTLKLTTLGSRNAGDRVNIETDIIGKYVAHFQNKTGERDNQVSFMSMYT